MFFDAVRKKAGGYTVNNSTLCAMKRDKRHGKNVVLNEMNGNYFLAFFSN